MRFSSLLVFIHALIRNIGSVRLTELDVKETLQVEAKEADTGTGWQRRHWRAGTPTTFSCETVRAGNHYPGRLNLPVVLGTERRPTRVQFVRFEANVVDPYPADFECATSWSKLWGASRCGIFHQHHQDSDRFVWRRAPDGSIEVAAYSYDSGRRPYSPTDANLLQPFEHHLTTGTVYRLQLDVSPAQTIYTLGVEDGAPIENKTVHHDNACSDASSGYKLGLYFGGSCTAPHAVTVCYSPHNGLSENWTIAGLLLVLVGIAGTVWGLFF